jgi:hypothetical protein
MTRRLAIILSFIIVGCFLVTPWHVSRFVRAAEPPLVLAFYYAWFDENIWTSGQPADQPVQPYSSQSRETIERQVDQAKKAGIDAFVQSWYGPQVENNQTETNFRTLLNVSAAKGFRAAVDLEVEGPFFPGKEEVIAALRYLLATHANHPAYLRYNDRPLIFFWRQQRFSVDEWAAIRQQIDPDHKTLWIAEGTDVNYQRVFDGHHLYSIAWSSNVEKTLQDWSYRIHRYERQHGVTRLWVATVMPGYDDTHLGRPDAFIRDRRDGAFYRESWQAAIASKPDIFLITSFNEWLEGTQIEPSVTYGDLYLRLTQEIVAKLREGESQPGPSASPTEVAGETSTVEPTSTGTPANTPTLSLTPTPSPTLTPVPSPSLTPSPTLTATIASTPTSAPTPTSSPTCPPRPTVGAKSSLAPTTEPPPLLVVGRVLTGGWLCFGIGLFLGVGALTILVWWRGHSTA